MSAQSGDRSRFHRLRKRKLALRLTRRALNLTLAVPKKIEAAVEPAK